MIPVLANGLFSCGTELLHVHVFNVTVPLRLERAGFDEAEACASVEEALCSVQGVSLIIVENTMLVGGHCTEQDLSRSSGKGELYVG